jgi:hypothetical protein
MHVPNHEPQANILVPSPAIAKYACTSFAALH